MLAISLRWWYKNSLWYIYIQTLDYVKRLRPCRAVFAEGRWLKKGECMLPFGFQRLDKLNLPINVWTMPHKIWGLWLDRAGWTWGGARQNSLPRTYNLVNKRPMSHYTHPEFSRPWWLSRGPPHNHCCLIILKSTMVFDSAAQVKVNQGFSF